MRFIVCTGELVVEPIGHVQKGIKCHAKGHRQRHHFKLQTVLETF